MLQCNPKPQEHKEADIVDIYQLLEPLSAPEYEALKSSIAEMGILHPIVVDELGIIIDGHHRMKIAKELKLPESQIPKVAVAGLSEEDKRTLSRNLNLARRNLTRTQKREIIKTQIKETPHLSDRQIAKLFGVSNSTVSLLRKNMVLSGELCDSHNTIESADGKKRHRPIVIRDPSPYEMSVLRNNPSVIDKMRDRGISNVAYGARLINLEAMSERENADITLSDKSIQLYTADIRNGLPMIENNSIHAIITDMPYERKYIDLYRHLSSVAFRVLIEGGSLLCLTGQAVLPEVLTLLSSNLQYNWTLSYVVSRTPALLPHKHVYSSQKPIVWFTKGEYKRRFVSDKIDAPPIAEDEKLYHPHQQSEGGFRLLVEAITDKGDIVADFTMGSGTTGVASVKAGRAFIGCDINQDYVFIAEARIKAALLEQQHRSNL